jgi:hypothetical protein
MPKRLPDPINAQELFRTGEQFYYAAKIYRNLPPPVWMPGFSAYVILSAFSVEAYLKVLAQLERGTPPLEGHSLLDLFGDLTSKSYRRVARDWERRIKKERGPQPSSVGGKFAGFPDFPTKFRPALIVSSKAFIEWRYGEASVPKGWMLDGAQDELREATLELKPEWRPTMGPMLVLNPEAQLAKAEGNRPNVAPGSAILNPKAPAFNVAVRRRSNPKDGGFS